MCQLMAKQRKRFMMAIARTADLVLLQRVNVQYLQKYVYNAYVINDTRQKKKVAKQFSLNNPVKGRPIFLLLYLWIKHS